MSQQGKKKYDRPVVGWIRVQKAKKDGRLFFPVSFKDGTQGILNIDKEKLNEVIASEGFGKDIIGTIVGDKEGFKRTGSAPKKPAADVDSDLPF